MEKLQMILSKSNYKYELIHHEKPIRSAKDGSSYFGIRIGQTAPSLILKTDRGYFYLVVSGERKKVCFEKIAELINCYKVNLASPDEVEKMTGFHVGSVAMIGIDLPCIVDKQLFQYDFIYGGTGEPTTTLKIEPHALHELNDVVALYE
ncbi:aminoacyl-tRNA deacylase [Niallia sp. 01092]|uniref:aminoacyl-tRNA deacylase n=1 Tax=unclassified Niallia TaxID=2837522 RepID=UPI003FD5FBC7